MFNILSSGTDDWGQYTIINQVEILSIAEEVRQNTNGTAYVRCVINAGGQRFNGTIFSKLLKDFPVGDTNATFRVRAGEDNGPTLTFASTYGESNNRNAAVVTSVMDALGLAPVNASTPVGTI